MKTNYYNQEGKKLGTAEISDVVFAAKWNAELVAQVVNAMQANARNTVAHALDRSEVRGGGKKPWKQKGTGRARHGSSRSPIWVGGGKAHGPRNERDYTQKINQKMRAKALYCALSQRMKDGAVVFVDSLTFSAPKTAAAKKVITDLAHGADVKEMATRRTNAILIATTTTDTYAAKSFANMGNVEVMHTKDLNPVAVLSYKYIVMTSPESASLLLAKRVSK